MSGVSVRKRDGEWVAVFELNAEECLAMASWIPMTDAAHREWLDAASAVNRADAEDQS